jgi:hypothetical protein
MKYTFNILLITVFFLSGLAFGQFNTHSTGPVPFLESHRGYNNFSEGISSASIAYGYSSIRLATLSIPIPSGTPLDSLNSWTSPGGFASSMTKGGDDRYYVIDFTPALYEFSPSDGSITLIGNIIGLGTETPNGIAYNPANEQYYLATSLNLYSFNISSRTATLIGPFNTGGGLMIDLAFTCGGTCYAYDLSNDNAYTVNINTGAATLLGPLGYDANFGQGMSIDHQTDIIYLSAFNNGTFTGQLRTMNPTTGATTLIVDWGFEQIAPFAIDVNCAPDPPTLQSPSNGATNISVNPTLSWNASSGADTYNLQIALSTTFSPNVEVTGITGTSYVVQSLPHNSQFYWRVSASSSSGTSAFSTAWNFRTVNNVTLTQTIQFPNRTNPRDYSSNDYKMIGLPGDDNLNVNAILSGTQGTDWESYWDNGDANDYFVKFSSSTPFQFTAGAAYWIVRKGNLVINQTVTGAAVSSAGVFAIPLEDGFNLITNPFIVPVTWSTVLTANGLVSADLNSFGGGWGTDSIMQPFVGYFFDNSTSLNQLVIPFPFGSEPLPKQNNQYLWRVSIDLSSGNSGDRTAAFGTSLIADDERDLFDHRKPRSLGSIPMVYFDHPEWDSEFSSFSTDIRSGIQTEQTWVMKISSTLRNHTTLTFNGIEEVPAELEVYLIDVDRANYTNLRQNNRYEFIPAKDISEFQIIVGKSEYINSKLDNILPTEFVLGSNFPNPFNPTTTFEVSVPEKSDIRIVVYNILGQIINVLFDGTAEAGRQWIVWDGKDQNGSALSSGVYVYNLITNTGVSISKKMVLMK